MKTKTIVEPAQQLTWIGQCQDYPSCPTTLIMHSGHGHPANASREFTAPCPNCNARVVLMRLVGPS